VQAGILGAGIKDADEGRMDEEERSLGVGAMIFEAAGGLAKSYCFEGKRQILRAQTLEEGLMSEAKWVDEDIVLA
jgi:hypothetical protein